MIKKALMVCALSAFAGAAAAAPITVNMQDGMTYDTEAVALYNTTGVQMAGMLVDVFYSDGSSEQVEWVAGEGTYGQAATDNWTLSLSGDSFSTRFRFQVGDIGDLFVVGLRMDGRSAQVVFDVVSDSVVSPGSAPGRTPLNVNGFSTTQATLLTDFTYRHQVGVQGVIHGDLYALLDIGFNDPELGGLASGGRISFLSDTDNTVSSIVLVSEPGALALMLAGLAGLGFVSRRSSKSA